jgi:hypothetical protein
VKNYLLPSYSTIYDLIEKFYDAVSVADGLKSRGPRSTLEVIKNVRWL